MLIPNSILLNIKIYDYNNRHMRYIVGIHIDHKFKTSIKIVTETVIPYGWLVF